MARSAAIRRGLLLLLLLLVLDGQRAVALGAAAGGLAVGLQRDRTRLRRELGDGLRGRDLGVDFRAQRFVGDAAEDAAVGWHVVVVAAVAHDDVALVGRAVVRGIERDPAVRG